MRSEDTNWKYTNQALYPPLTLEADYVESGQIETRYTHTTQVEVHHYRLVTNWTCAYNGSGSLITAIIYRKTGNDWLHSVNHVLVREEIQAVDQEARQYAVKLHSELVRDHLSM